MAGTVSSTGRATRLLECASGGAAMIPVGAGEDLGSGRGTSPGRPVSRVRPTVPPTTVSSPARTTAVAMGRRTSRARDPRCPPSGSASSTTGSAALPAFSGLPTLASLAALPSLPALLNLPNRPGLVSSMSSSQKNHGCSACPTGGSPSQGDPPVTGLPAGGSTDVTGDAPHLAHPV